MGLGNFWLSWLGEDRGRRQKSGKRSLTVISHLPLVDSEDAPRYSALTPRPSAFKTATNFIIVRKRLKNLFMILQPLDFRF
ncbi:hypothetical protein H6G93_14060 [Nostoc sp. FACHB-973]|nr:hypothetical protein [Nostoc sp. FACHB-973]MBX9259493.1 hypothetical protein [Desmonostoc muscorum CCALA 125]